MILGSSPFARHYLGNLFRFLFLGLLRWFTSPGSPLLRRRYLAPAKWVSPFGYRRVNARSQLTVAFRSLPRPSSPPVAKASTACPYYLNLSVQFSMTAGDEGIRTPDPLLAKQVLSL